MLHLVALSVAEDSATCGLPLKSRRPCLFNRIQHRTLEIWQEIRYWFCSRWKYYLLFQVRNRNIFDYFEWRVAMQEKGAPNFPPTSIVTGRTIHFINATVCQFQIQFQIYLQEWCGRCRGSAACRPRWSPNTSTCRNPYCSAACTLTCSWNVRIQRLIYSTTLKRNALSHFTRGTSRNFHARKLMNVVIFQTWSRLRRPPWKVAPWCSPRNCWRTTARATMLPLAKCIHYLKQLQ